jgi:hypothetical protein
MLITDYYEYYLAELKSTKAPALSSFIVRTTSPTKMFGDQRINLVYLVTWTLIKQ